MTAAKSIPILVACASLLLIALFSCDDYFLDPPPPNNNIITFRPEDFGATPTASASAVPSPTAATPAVPVDQVAAFKKFVMADRAREPDWFARVTHVWLVNGTLSAETTLPPDWSDTSTPSRPVESICVQLFAYAQRGARLAWTTITVEASDGTALVTRQGVGGSCRAS